MHELSIAMSIVDIAIEELGKAGGEKVTEVEVNIGSLSGVQVEALQFTWDVAVKNTEAAASSLKINTIAARAVCSECKHEFIADDLMAKCTECGSYLNSIHSGREMRVVSVLIE